MHKGTIILIPFPFTDLSGQKVRPAVVLSVSKKGNDLIACFISSKQSDAADSFGLKIKAAPDNGLKIDSVIKIAKIATLEKKIALGEIGRLDQKFMKEIDRKLKLIFSL